MYKITDITAVTVVCNTRVIFSKMYTAFRFHHPTMRLIIIDNSDRTNDCSGYVRRLGSNNTIVKQYGRNLGHGRGLNNGISFVRTPLALIMDSDTVMIKSPLPEMLNLMDEETYGVGWIYNVGKDGYDFGTFKHHKTPIPYLHPYFALLSVSEFYKYPPFVHHGAPFFKTMVDIYKKGLSDKILKRFDGLTGHTSGQGINWIGKPSEYIQHDFGGTRKEMKKLGRLEIEGNWEV